MQENTPGWLDEIITFITKAFIVTSFIAVTIKVAIQMDREKMTLKKIMWAYITGIGFTMLLYPLIHEYVEESWKVPIAGLVAISGEKIGVYLVYKFNFEIFITSFLDLLLSKFKNKKE